MFVILNPIGNLWSQQMFDTEEEARKYLESTLSWIKPNELEHTIVPSFEVHDLNEQVQYFEELEY